MPRSGGMTHAYILWIATFAYALHVLEEFAFDWKQNEAIVLSFNTH